MSVQIIIKSFNRPYYLERCLLSISKFVKGDFDIHVVDDGTPKVYLDKLKNSFPKVKFSISEEYDEKILAIQKNLDLGDDINGFQIPTKLWKDAVKSSISNYVLVIEDDVWFKDEINIQLISKEMEENQVNLVKLGWLGNFSDDQYVNIQSLTAKLDAIIPKNLFTSNPFVMDLFMYNKFKFFTILYKLGWVNNQTKRKYWVLNSILMGLYHKDYWLYIWKDANGKVDEKQQLRNATSFYHHNKKNQNFIARTKKEFLQTTFQSSATNSYHKYGFDFDVNYLNHLLNQVWLQGSFDSMQNFPNDFTLDYFVNFFDEKLNKEEFRKWVEKFKKQYRNLGAQVDG